MHDEYADVRDALACEPWIVSPWFKDRHRGDSTDELEVVCDAHAGEPAEYRPDYPLSFAAAGRIYADRPVYRFSVPNPSKERPVTEPAKPDLVLPSAPHDHDPMSCF